jgi:hypothetical protein
MLSCFHETTQCIVIDIVRTLGILQAKGALESATKAEDWATRELLKMSRDSKRVCRLIVRTFPKFRFSFLDL